MGSGAHCPGDMFNAHAHEQKQKREVLTLKRETLAAMKREAIDALVRRGYAVRGKTTTQIREILRHRPTLPRPPAATFQA